MSVEDGKFRRRTGFVESNPRNFIDGNLPKCPFCKDEPKWHWQLSFHLARNRFHFRCSNCNAIFSIPSANLMKPIPLAIALSSRDNAMVVESVGNSKNYSHLEGNSIQLNELKQLIEEVRRCPNCGRVIPEDARYCPYCSKKFW